MNAHDKDRLLLFYEDSLKEYGDNDARSVHWADEKNQFKRFLVLSQIADLSGKKVLDLGCGLGDLYKFFLNNQIPVDYMGIDIVPEFVEKAKARFPSVRFDVKNMEDIAEHFDYILASGVFSFKVKDHKDFYFSVIQKLFTLCDEGFAFNMLNSEHHIDDETFATYNPNEVADFCKTLTSNVQIVMGYLPQDFTIYLYKN